MQRTQIRIVSGSLRGRKIECLVHESMRPTPQMVREALFSILGNAVPGRVFYDIFSGTGVNGFEAISRGAKQSVFLERDPKLANEIERYLNRFTVTDRGQVIRTDVYRWAERWIPLGGKPVNLFLSPPFPDLGARHEAFEKLVRTLIQKMPDNSVIALQTEDGYALDWLPDLDQWDIRKYGRNVLAFWVKEAPDADDADADNGAEADASPKSPRSSAIREFSGDSLPDSNRRPADDADAGDDSTSTSDRA
ncbi:RsmD family RNA methyltransferase [Tuwongella immobilis]|uniref:16S rRNA (Guanine(966)-N(2))-methyltransferase RsmD n=1 Tax=Tuwongella immobilis TaxID=692036 RepID=A0A6C2YNF4_9BACT|nr:RsmD family RNA methyltransferase [Tuwongella immobilis]VIP02966.1 methyltransferase : RNA methyltransferase, RsmD family OS=Singulisphaera acidiphila (strain ATCC BAA-1392 / DSM 18658 / VKM B-2454 / MOB10) GN=Sinac_5937 PE=4 SV=1: Cons_hypoth95 [Tuwongella immobilis]VTS02986.1 methyltransferase : RNA methyltransferase, RsmD family OS=Singulisphaera acidiphila (strain ATCC BAA-1392 / DSM 18658 / VKM B-2454 / MOB10) GN=Sinac_5937 PE=4 SV=1: Cons_hypoth95 [Tuwongella immobilis]